MAVEPAMNPGIPDAEGDREQKVYTWPYLVRIEAIGALLYVILFSVMAILINAPLRNLANPEVTPNPAKAPWYFLGLQELLLHMSPALAGVVVPTAVLVGLAAIPYIDSRRQGTGIYFSGKNGIPIFVFSFLYTTVWNIVLILIDEFLVLPGMEAGSHGIGPVLKVFLVPALGPAIGPAIGSAITDVVVPAFLMLFIPTLLVILVRRIWKADTREVMIALFTFFLASFVVLTMSGTAFRGHSMKLFWPWQVGHPEEPLQ